MVNQPNHPEETEILVNEMKVQILGSHPSGHHIKTSAIEQGVPIEPTFQLMLERPEGERPIEDSEHLDLHPGMKFKSQPHQVVILVNEQEVSIQGHRATGLKIKETAISQGVSIQLDFVLSLEFEPRKSRVIGDDEIVVIHKHSRFLAVAPDDNSQC